MNGLMTMMFRGAALALGMFLTYCETSGTYEYLMKDQGAFNYIVKAGCGVTIGTALLPVFAGMAWRAKKHARALLLWLIFPLAVGVVFFAAIDRTGGTADLAQQQRAKDARAHTIIDPTQRLCQECSIQTRVVGKRIYLLDVQLGSWAAKPLPTVAGETEYAATNQ